VLPVDPGLLTAFLAVSVVLSAIPGPSIVFATGRAVVHGRGVGMWTVVGDSLGGWFLVALVAGGLGGVVAQSAVVFSAVKLAGAAYLVFLGARGLLSVRRAGLPLAEAEGGLRGGIARRVREGFVLGTTNPKSIVFLAAVLPQFVDPQRGALVLQMLLIGAMGGLLQLAVSTGWVLAASGLRGWFARRPSRVAALNGIGGLTMIGFGARLTVQQRPVT
jgi:threonine/homoserine/homoserine lactone efflux protein